MGSSAHPAAAVAYRLPVGEEWQRPIVLKRNVSGVVDALVDKHGVARVWWHELARPDSYDVRHLPAGRSWRFGRNRVVLIETYDRP
jgi:hypothetical protein